MSSYARVLASVQRRLLVLIAALAVILAATLVTAPQADAASRGERIQKARKIALNQIGDPYSYGAAGPNRFDCSGLIFYATHKAGFKGVPRSSGAQSKFLRNIKKKNLRRGDFMYFYNSGGVYHAGIFLGRKKGKVWLLHSPRPGSRVHKTTAWTSKWHARTLRR